MQMNHEHAPQNSCSIHEGAEMSNLTWTREIIKNDVTWLYLMITLLLTCFFGFCFDQKGDSVHVIRFEHCVCVRLNEGGSHHHHHLLPIIVIIRSESDQAH